MASKRAHPPKPKLVIRLGVTGHRANRFPKNAQAIVRRKADLLLAQIIEAAVALHGQELEFFDPAPPQIRIVSALAEGADRVIAEAGLAAGYPLDAVLPFPQDIYEADFEAAESKAQYRAMLEGAQARFILPGSKSDQSEADRAYEAAGLITLRQCDLLIAVWDGKESSGRGGTEDIVQRAVENARPVLRFDTQGNGPFLLFGASPSDARDLAARQAAEVDPRAVADLVAHLCAPPGSKAEAKNGESTKPTRARRRLQRFLNERERRIVIAAPWYPLLITMLSDKTGFWNSFRKRPFLSATMKEWEPYSAGLVPTGQNVDRLLYRVVLPRFAWADKLADHYGQLHRSGYITNFALAALSVLFAGVGQQWSIVAEFAAIVLILVSTIRGRRYRWHQRWLDYRQLSAQLRHLRALVPTGSAPWEVRTPHAGEDVEPGPLWVSWYYRLTLRETGLPEVKIDASYIATIRCAIAETEVKGQIAYHQANARQMHKVGRRLEWLSYIAFAATALVCLYEVCSLLRPELHLPSRVDDLLNVASFVLPAIGAATFGMRVYGDFEGSAQRSHSMAERLSWIAARLDEDKPMSFAELSALVEHAVDIMASELGDWSFVFRARPLSLPT